MVPRASPCAPTPRHGERDSRAHGEQKKRKDEVGWRPTVPRSVFERPVDRIPRAGRAHENHGRNRGAAEHVERLETPRVHLGRKEILRLAATAIALSRQDDVRRRRPREDLVRPREAVEKPAHHMHLSPVLIESLAFALELALTQRNANPSRDAARQARRRRKLAPVTLERPAVEVNHVRDQVGAKSRADTRHIAKRIRHEEPGGADPLAAPARRARLPLPQQAQPADDGRGGLGERRVAHDARRGDQRQPDRQHRQR